MQVETLLAFDGEVIEIMRQMTEQTDMTEAQRRTGTLLLSIRRAISKSQKGCVSRRYIYLFDVQV